MQHASVEKLFKEQIQHYSKHGQYNDSPLLDLILEWLKRKTYRRKVAIGEFGGGNGQLLGDIQKAYPRVSLTNVEIVKEYKQTLVSKKIRFVPGSILDPHFHEESFDVLIIRDVLHHLVGNSYDETLNNQKMALTELKRLVKPGGVIFIEELINESEISTRMIYYLSWLNTKIGVHIPSLFISKNVIVAFLTSNRLLKMCREVFQRRNINKQELEVRVRWYFVLLHLFGGLKKIILTIKQ